MADPRSRSHRVERPVEIAVDEVHGAFMQPGDEKYDHAADD
jgi:hypothetical protein